MRKLKCKYAKSEVLIEFVDNNLIAVAECKQGFWNKDSESASWWMAAYMQLNI